MEIKTVPPLWVLFEGKTIGSLAYEPKTEEFTFAYSQPWVAEKKFYLSPNITPSGVADKGSVTRFLENLLPEGEGLRNLARLLKVNSSNLYALIEAIGAETTGALTINRNAEEPKSQYRPIEHDELTERIHERKSRPITTWDEKPRLSVAGVQEKLPVMEKDGKFGLGEGAYASTHILKFGNERTKHLVLNEYFCMKLARTSGMNVADCELLDFNERVLNVRRFDRFWQGDERVKRAHLIDGCQALDLPPRAKYERFLGDQAHVKDITGPATLKNLYQFCDKTKVPAQARLALLQWVTFNLLIGNCDCHIKNVSFFIDDAGLTLAPFYDLVSVTMYPELEQSLAFHIGDTFLLEEVNAYHLAEMASELDLNKSFVASQLQKVIRSTLKSLPKTDIPGVTETEMEFLEKMRHDIGRRCQKFLADVPKMSKFTSI